MPNAEIDRTVAHILATSGTPFEVRDFTPYGYDERQYCSPGYNLAVGSLTRTPHGEYPEYHTSADNLDLVNGAALEASLNCYWEVVEALEGNRRFRNLVAKGDPQLGRRGLYRSLGGHANAEAHQMALLWILNLSDGEHSLLDIAERSNLPISMLRESVTALVDAGILLEC